MTKEIRKRFIDACAKESIKSWAEEREFNLDLLKQLKIGKCTVEVMAELKQQYNQEQLRNAGFLNSKEKWKYINRIIIPFEEDYFAARQLSGDPKYKNLFPKGLKKRIYYIEGIKNNDCYIVEGETDAIRLKHEFQDAHIISIGGCKSKILLSQILKKINNFNPNRVLFCFDNDAPGKQALISWTELITKHPKRHYIKEKLFTVKFDEKYKDIDEYFINHGKKENLLYEKIEIIEQTTKDSIYSNNFVLPVDNYYDNAKKFFELQPYFYDKSGLFWMWDTKESKYKYSDDIDLMVRFDKILRFEGQTVNSKIKNQTMEAMKRFGRINNPPIAKKKWIQFKDKAYSIFSGKIHKVTSDYFFTNPIPWELGTSEETPIMDKLFKDWVGEENVQSLYEIIAYCCYRDYPIQMLFCLYGAGRNGKSCFLRLIDKFIGSDNVCSTELDLIVGRNKSRFEIFKLYKKLICIMGETNFGTLDNTSLLKRLTGADKIGFEKKGKDPFDEYSYAKILIASNSLPSSSDTSDGFYRRWHIINFPNEFPEGKDVLETIPEHEYNNLALKVMRILPQLLNNGEFTNQGSIEKRKEKYILASNPLPYFLQKNCVFDEEKYVSYKELYTKYVLFLKKSKKRKVTMKEFKSALEDEGFFPEKTSKPDGFDEKGYQKYKIIYWVDGLCLKENNKNFAHFARFTQNATQIPREEDIVANMGKMGKEGKIDLILKKIEQFPENNASIIEKEFDKAYLMKLVKEGTLYLKRGTDYGIL